MDGKIKFLLLQGRFALVYSAAAFSLLVLSTAWAKNLPTDTSKQQQEEPQTVIISATPGVLRLTESWFELIWKSEDYVCAEFYVQAMRHPVTEVLITSTGLGQATFSLPFNFTLTECAKANSKENIVMSLRDLDCNARKVRLRLHRVSFPETGSVVEAKILVFVPPKESIEIPLRLEGQAASSFLTAATWFLGILIPTLMTGLLGYLWYVLQKQWDARSAEQSAFEQYMNKNWRELDILFKDFYPNLCSQHGNTDQEWARELYEKLQVSILEKTPQKYQNALRKVLAAGKRDDITKCLTTIFPDWKGAIEAPWKS